MACTTILVGKKASYDGSTMIARNDDSGSGHFTAKKFVVVQPEELDAALVSANADLQDSTAKLKALDAAIREKKELQTQALACCLASSWRFILFGRSFCFY